VTFVHYKAAAQRLTDLMGGLVHVSTGTPLSSIGFIKSGKLRAIGVTGPQRSKLMPDVPRVSETVPGYEFSSWLGMMAPAKAQPYVISRVNEIFTTASKDPDVIKRIEGDDALMVNSSPADFSKFLVDENRRLAKVIKDAGIKAEE